MMGGRRWGVSAELLREGMVRGGYGLTPTWCHSVPKARLVLRLLPPRALPVMDRGEERSRGEVLR